MVFNTSVCLNMTYGIKPSPGLDWPAIKRRALKIAKRLGMSIELTNDYFETDGYLGANGVRITRADRQLISLGRALVMNPELIICHKPTSLLDDRQVRSCFPF
jgi:ABC-type multidrug transport system fused ATPase/permease subunit